jgi:hypothetical protein
MLVLDAVGVLPGSVDGDDPNCPVAQDMAAAFAKALGGQWPHCPTRGPCSDNSHRGGQAYIFVAFGSAVTVALGVVGGGAKTENDEE